MLKKIILLLAIAALAAPALIQITPEQVKHFWTVIDNEARATQVKVHDNYSSNLLKLVSWVVITSMKFRQEANEHNEDFLSEMTKIEEEAEKEGKDITSCISAASERLEAYELDVQFPIQLLAEEGSAICLNETQLVDSTVTALDALEESIDNCKRMFCASKLNTKIHVIYRNFNEQLTAYYQRFNQIHQEVKAMVFDGKAYDAKINKLLKNTKQCVSES